MSDNPLSHESFDTVMQKAEIFWRYHGLDAIVEEDEFRKGALVIKDLEGARQFEHDSASHTAAEQANYSEREKLLSKLTSLQRTSLRWYTCRTKYLKEHKADAVVKRMLFAIGDALADVLWGEPNGPEDKLLWDHIKSFSTAQWQIISTCCLAAMTQGWDQSGMNGANIAWPEQLGIERDTVRGINLFGWLNAAPFFIGALVGSLITDPLINAGLGRRWAIALGGWSSLLPVVCTLFVKDWVGFMCCRIALGIGMGAKASVVPIYISEIAPEDIRGRLSMCWQLFDTLGILVGNIVNYIVFRYTQDSPSWRIMISISGIPALLFLTMILFCVESPRWLVKKNRFQEALTALIALHQLPSPIIACGELYIIFRRLEAEQRRYLMEANNSLSPSEGLHGINGDVPMRPFARVFSPAPTEQEQQSGRENRSDLTSIQRKSINSRNEQSNNVESDVRREDGATLARTSSPIEQDPPPKLKDIGFRARGRLLSRVKHMRRALRASQLVMAAQQACGINILAFMSTVMFAHAMNASELDNQAMESALKFSIYFGIANHFSTFVPLFLIDGAGRRALLKFTFPLMAITLLLSGAGLFIRDANPAAGQDLFYAFTIIFTFFFSIGEGPAAFVISAEVFPLIVRELGMSLAVFTNFFLASILSFFIPYATRKAADNGGFWMAFGALNLVLWLLSLLFVYETSGEKLEGVNKKYDQSWKDASWLGKRISELQKKKWFGEGDVYQEDR